MWLAGWAWSNSHFHGIWITYATVDPEAIDPTLGGPEGVAGFVASHGARSWD